MGLALYMLIAILWGGFTMYRWERGQCGELDNDEKMGAACIGIFCIFTIPFYLMFWSMRGISHKIHKELMSGGEPE
jgi:hypothetical protein